MFAAVLVQIRDGYMCTGGGETLGDGPANTLGSTRHNSDTSLKIALHGLSFTHILFFGPDQQRTATYAYSDDTAP